MLAPPPGFAQPKAAAAKQASAQQAAPQAGKPEQAQRQAKLMLQVCNFTPPEPHTDGKRLLMLQSRVTGRCMLGTTILTWQYKRDYVRMSMARLILQSQINLNTAPDKGKQRQEASQAVPPMTPQLSKGQDGQASIISSKTAKSAEQARPSLSSILNSGNFGAYAKVSHSEACRPLHQHAFL